MSEDGEENIPVGPSGLRFGRPPRYNNCLDLAWDIESYFDYCDEGETVTKYDKNGKPYEVVRAKPYMLLGLPVYLRMDRDAFWSMEQRSNDFATVLKNARTRIELQRGEQLINSDANTIGSIFLLKAYHGLRDTPEQQQSSGITVVIEGGSTIKLQAGQAQDKAIDCDYQTVSVALPQGSE